MRNYVPNAANISGAMNLADILTKLIPRARFGAMLRDLGLASSASQAFAALFEASGTDVFLCESGFAWRWQPLADKELRPKHLADAVLQAVLMR